MCPFQFTTGDLRLPTYKAASACHIYGPEFAYVVDVCTCLEEKNERDLFLFLQLNIGKSIRLCSSFAQNSRSWLFLSKDLWWLRTVRLIIRLIFRRYVGDMRWVLGVNWHLPQLHKHSASLPRAGANMRLKGSKYPQIWLRLGSFSLSLSLQHSPFTLPLALLQPPHFLRHLLVECERHIVVREPDSVSSLHDFTKDLIHPMCWRLVDILWFLWGSYRSVRWCISAPKIIRTRRDLWGSHKWFVVRQILLQHHLLPDPMLWCFRRSSWSCQIRYKQHLRTALLVTT